MSLQAQLAHELAKSDVETKKLPVDLCVLRENGKFTLIPMTIGEFHYRKDAIVEKRWRSFVDFQRCIVDLIRIHCRQGMRPLYLYLIKDLRFGPCIPLTEPMYDYFKTDVTPHCPFTVVATSIPNRLDVQPYIRLLPIEFAKEALH